MDDLTGLGKVGVQAIQTAEKFLERLLGPWLDEAGQHLADSVRAKRRANLYAVAARAQEFLGDQELRRVPGRVLYPLLDAASNEDDRLLQERWAVLLAAAASATSTYEISVGYITALANLSPDDVRFINYFVPHLEQRQLVADRTFRPHVGLPDDHRFNDSQLIRITENLERLGIIEFESHAHVDLNQDRSRFDAPVEQRGVFSFTHFGIGLVLACQPQKAST